MDLQVIKVQKETKDPMEKWGQKVRRETKVLSEIRVLLDLRDQLVRKVRKEQEGREAFRDRQVRQVRLVQSVTQVHKVETAETGVMVLRDL